MSGFQACRGPESREAPLDAVTAPPSAEIVLGLLLIRLVLPVSILAGLIWAHVRISMALRNRLDLPADIKATLLAFKHQTTEMEEALQRHISRDAARHKKDVDAVKAAQPHLPGAPVPDEGPTGPVVPMSVWLDANEPQREAWRIAGMAPAEVA